MLVKDHIKVTKLSHKTESSLISISLAFLLNNNKVQIKASYIPDKFRVEQPSVLNYLNELVKSETLTLEDLSARVTEDLFDLSVPKKLDLSLEQTLNDISTSISTSKKQAGFKG